MNAFCFDKKGKEKVLLKQRPLSGKKFRSGTGGFGLKDTTHANENRGKKARGRSTSQKDLKNKNF